MRADAPPAVSAPPGISRLRLRLSAAFTVTFIVALAAVAAGSLGWLMRESTRRLDGRLDALGTAVSRAIAMEKAEFPDSGLAAVVDDVRREWVLGPDAWMVLDRAGVPIAATVDSVNRARVLATQPTAARGMSALDGDRAGDDLRIRPMLVPPQAGLPAYTILTVASTEPIERDAQLLALALAVATPLIAVVALLGGYLLSRWALRPTETLGRAIDALEPAALGTRLPVPMPPDEIGRLAQRFNALLDRLAASQSRNRAFVREAAHQIRTPLTLVRGEADLALRSASSDPGTLRDALGRIERASRQMQRRVDELFLLAEAEAGTTLEHRVPVDIEALVLDGIDLFRARAALRAHPITFGPIARATVLGDQTLLTEALLELLENACRHGSTARPIVVAIHVRNRSVDVVVESCRPPEDRPATPPSTGLGQRIVRWIAEVHDGEFSVEHDHTGRYLAKLTLPVAMIPQSVRAATPT